MTISDCLHDVIVYIGQQEDGEGGEFPLYSCTAHPTKRLPRHEYCGTTITDVVFGGSIDFVGQYHLLIEHDGKKYYYRDPRENKNPSRCMTT